MTRLGLGYEMLKERKPDLVYCAISGFGQTGPLKDNPAYDQIIQGLSGIMSITGTPETAPLRVGYPVCDTLGGLTGAFAVAAALVRRARTGEGAFLDVSILVSTLSALGWPVSIYLPAGLTPRAAGNENVTGAPSGTFRCADAVLNISANKQSQFEILCDLIGRPELKQDPRFAEREARLVNRAALNVLIEKELASASAAEWEARLNKAGVPAGRVLSVPQALAEPQVVERQMTARFEAIEGVDRPVTVARCGFLVDGEAPHPSLPPPRLGEHTEEVLGKAGKR
jgi:crotonobetainyl-CoA:carnitine CoA-transferase CaiB-like acyl-CoA transferase